MIKYCISALVAVAALFSNLLAPAFAQDNPFPIRQTARPVTTNSVPHVQIGVDGIPELSAQLLRRVDRLPDVEIQRTVISLPGAKGFSLNKSVALAHPEAIVGGREFAHIHPDGSLHAALDPKIARAAVKAGWAIPHPWANQRAGWEGFVMIYSPNNGDELDVVFQLVTSSYEYVTGRDVVEK